MNEKNIDTWRTLMEKGTFELGQGEYKQAEKSFLQSLRIANKLGIPVIKAFNIRLLAFAQIKQGKVETAEKGFNEALRICEEISNRKGISEALAGLASVAVENNNLKLAVEYYNKAIKSYPNSSPKLRLAMLFSDLGQVYAMMELWDQAEKTYTKAMELCHKHNYPKGEGELRVLIGEACFHQGQRINAKSHLIQACRLFIQINEVKSLINALQYTAFIYFEQGKYEDARHTLQRALILQLYQGHTDDIYESSFFLAKILNGQGALDEAIYYLSLSLKLHKEKDIGYALRIQNMAKLLTAKKEYIRGKVHYKEAADLFEYLGDDLRQGECYDSLAQICDILGEEEEAKKYRQEAQKTLTGLHAISLSAVQRLAEYYEQRRSYLNALKCYWQSLHIAREIGYETAELEKAVQRISKRVRKKN